MKKPRLVNRAAIILTPKRPFYEWLRALPDPIELTPEVCKEYSAVYLVPEYEDSKEQQAVLKSCFSIVFEEVLVGWWTFADQWPDTKDLKLFLEWFDVTMYAMVFDLVKAQLERE